MVSALTIPIFFTFVCTIWGSVIKDNVPCKVKETLDLKCQLLTTYLNEYPGKSLLKLFAFLGYTGVKQGIHVFETLAAEGLYYKLCLNKSPVEFVVNNNKDNLRKVEGKVSKIPPEQLKADLHIACDLGKTIYHSIQFEDMKNKATVLYNPIANSDEYKKFMKQNEMICDASFNQDLGVAT